MPGSGFVVVTGGPGSGKSTLLAALAADGFPCSDEAGRGVIRQQVAIGGRALPWVDPGLFAELMLGWELRSYRLAEAAGAEVVFFDRGVPDVAGYLRVAGLEVPAHVHAAASAYTYHRRVLVAPPWPAIYTRDADRKQSPAEAERTYEAMIAVYTAYGYEPVHIPRVPVAERVAFVREFLAAGAGGRAQPGGTAAVAIERSSRLPK